MIVNNKIAAIDVGTNSFHMVVANVDANGLINITAREKEVVRLGSSSGDMKFLKSDAISRGVQTLSRFAKIAKAEKAEIRAVATSAIREAENKAEFVNKVYDKTGIEVEVVSGLEEARLINIGVMHALPIYRKKALVIDIGGGSTETILSEKGETHLINSIKLGAIRLTKRYFENINIDSDSIAKCQDYIKGEWQPLLEKVKEIGFDIFIGTSGTIQTIVSMAYLERKNYLPEITNGLTVSSKDFLNTIDKIKSAKTANEISKLNGVDTSRADILLAGSLIIEFAIKYLGIKKIVISAYALREGIVFETVQKRTTILKFQHLADLRYQSVLNVIKKYYVDLIHSEHVRKICSDIFNDLKDIHKFGIEEEEILESAALLHDIGIQISLDSHHRHSYYIIKNCILPGFTNDEQELIANISRYHRKSMPKEIHENYTILSNKEKRIVWVLGGILRIAEGIDRRQIQSVGHVKCKVINNKVMIELCPSSSLANPDIELWGANRRKEMLEIALDMKIEIDIA